MGIVSKGSVVEHEFTTCKPGSAGVLLRLLQLASPALPVGAYSYSQGLEWVVERGQVLGAPGVCQWIGDVLRDGMARCEAVYLVHMLRAWRSGDAASALRHDESFAASRDTAELRAETLQMGFSMRQLLKQIGVPLPEALDQATQVTFPCAWSYLAHHWQLPEEEAVTGYLWSWLENQVMAAVKCVPLGQSEGQRLLIELSGQIGRHLDAILGSSIEDAVNALPGYALASCLHETQYTRLFRS